VDLKQAFTRLTKADFADALGIALTDGVVAAAHVQKRFNNVKVAAVDSRVIDAPEEARWTVVIDFLRHFVEQHGVEAPRIAVVLGGSDVLIGHIQLPATAVENLGQVVGYEIDRIVPFPPEAVYAHPFARPMGTAGERVAVTVVAGVRERIDDVQKRLAAVDLAPSAITGQQVALSDYYAFCRGDEPGTAGIFYRDGDREHLTLSSHGLLISSLRFDPGREGREARLVREMECSLPDRAGEVADIVVDEGAGEHERELADLAPPGFLPAGRRPTCVEIMAVGATLGRLGESRAKVNLLPTDQIPMQEGFGLREVALGSLVVILAATLAGSIAVKNLTISSALAREVDSLEPRVTQVTRTEEENRRLQSRVEFLETNGSTNVTSYLKEMTEKVPKSAYLTTFRYKGDRIEVDGIASNASELISVLERSPQFKNVEFTAPTTKYLQDQERFSLRMGLEQ